jgi:hypothetical protein
VRDHEGCTLAAKTMTKLAILEYVATKALVALYVAEFSQDLGLQSINMEDDVVQVVNAMKACEWNWRIRVKC